MKKIFFIGSKHIGFKCLEHVYNQVKKLNLDISGVLTNDKGHEIKNFCKNKNIPILDSLKDYLSIRNIDTLISVQYHEILKKIHLENAKRCFNLHMAPLPEYRGCNQFTYAILNQESTFGTTIHLMDEGIDSGDIVFQKRFDIPKDIWVEELYNQTVRNSIDLFRENFKDLINDNFLACPQSDFPVNTPKNFYLRSEIDKLKKIDLNDGPEKIKRIIRSLAMPGHQGPYIEIDKKKFYLASSQS